LRLNRFLRRSPPAAVVLTITNLAAQGFNFLGGLIAARLLGPAGRGNLALVAVYDDIANRALSLGVPAAVGRYAARPVCEDKRVVEARLLGAALRIAAMSLPATALLAWAVFALALGDSPSSIKICVALAIGLTPIANSVPMAGRMILVARGELNLLSVVIGGSALLRLVGFVAFAQWQVLTATNAALILLISGWLGNGLTLFLVGVMPARGGRAGPLLKFGLQTVPASFANLANSRLDQVLIAPFLGPSELGIYAVAVGVAFVPINVGSTLGLAAYRAFARARSGDEYLRKVLGRSSIYVAVSGIMSAVGAVTLIVPIYGEQFSESVTPAVLLIVGSVAMGIAMVLGQASNAAGFPRNDSVSSVAALVFTVIGLPIFLPMYGLVGAAAVSAVAYSVRALVGYWMLRRSGLLGDRHR
jgi:O-antigen/teichoic acid export membrane protein